MAGRSSTTLQKRQKEQARAEKQREKFAKRLDKKKGGGLPELPALGSHGDPDFAPIDHDSDPEESTGPALDW